MAWEKVPVGFNPFAEDDENELKTSADLGILVSQTPDDFYAKNRLEPEGPKGQPGLPFADPYDPMKAFADSPEPAQFAKGAARPSENLGVFGKSWGMVDEAGQQADLQARRDAYNQAQRQIGQLERLRDLPVNRGRRAAFQSQIDARMAALPDITQIARMEEGFAPLVTKTTTRAGVETALRSAGDNILSIPEMVGIAKGYLGPGQVDDDALLQWSLGAKDWLERQFPGDAARQTDFSQQLAAGLGQIATFYGAGVAAATAKAGPKLTAALIALFGGTATGSQGFEEATAELEKAKAEAAQRGDTASVTELDRLLKTIGYSGVGLTEAVPIARTFSRVAPTPTTSFGHRMIQGVEGAAEEALQESGAQVAQNVISGVTTDPERSATEGVAESAQVGGVLGFMMNALMPGRFSPNQAQPSPGRGAGAGVGQGGPLPLPPPASPPAAPESGASPGVIDRGALQVVEEGGPPEASEPLALPAPQVQSLRSEVERQIRATPALSAQAEQLMRQFDDNPDAQPLIQQAVQNMEATGRTSLAARGLIQQLGSLPAQEFGTTQDRVTTTQPAPPQLPAPTQATPEAGPAEMQRFDDALFAIGDQGAPAREIDKLGYYSKALEQAKTLPQERGTGEQMLAMLRRAGVKDSEIAATGLGEFLAGKPAVTKQEIIQHLTDNRIQLDETLYGGRPHPRVVAAKQAYEDAYDEVVRLENASTEYEMRGEAVPAELEAERRAANEILNRARMEAYGEELREFERSPTRWSAYSLDPGNPTYQEVVISLGETPKEMAENEQEAIESQEYDDLLRKSDAQGGRLSGADADRFLELGRSLKKHRDRRRRYGQTYRSGHWDQPNVVVHVRSQELRDTKGRRSHNIDEMQSDWGQTIRDDTPDETKIAKLLEEIADLQKRWDDDSMLKELFPESDDFIYTNLGNRPANADQRMRSLDIIRRSEFARSDVRDQARDYFQAILTTNAMYAPKMRRLNSELSQERAKGYTPRHPLVNTTDQWMTTALRRIIAQAVEAGVDGISITPGKIQADRYDLTKAVEALRYAPDIGALQAIRKGDSDGGWISISPDGKEVSPGQLPDIVGREVAARLLEAPRQAMGQGSPYTAHVLSGVDLEVGGKGMLAAYDNIYPRALTKILQKMDKSIKPEKVRLVKHDFPLNDGGAPGSSVSRQEQAENADYPGGSKFKNDFFFIPITDKVRQQVREEGQPLFALAGESQEIADALTTGVQLVQDWHNQVDEHFAGRPVNANIVDVIERMATRYGDTRSDLIASLREAGLGRLPDPLVDQGVLAIEVLRAGENAPLFALDGFFNPIIKAVEDAKQEKATAEQWKRLLQGPGIRQELVNYMGVMEWLDEQGTLRERRPGSNAPKTDQTISKEELLDFLRSHDLEIEREVLLSEGTPEWQAEQQRIADEETARRMAAWERWREDNPEPTAEESLEEDEDDPFEDMISDDERREEINENAQDYYDQLRDQAIDEMMEDWARENDPDRMDIEIYFRGHSAEERRYEAAVRQWTEDRAAWEEVARNQLFLPLPGVPRYDYFDEEDGPQLRSYIPDLWDEYDGEFFYYNVDNAANQTVADSEDYYRTREAAREAAESAIDGLREDYDDNRDRAHENILNGNDFAEEWSEAQNQAERDWDNENPDWVPEDERETPQERAERERREVIRNRNTPPSPVQPKRFADQTKFARYKISGGKGYGELLVKLPRLREKGYSSPHFHNNEVVHVRYDLRQGPNGELVLFVHEIQSDLHQRARGFGYGEEGLVRAREVHSNRGFSPELKAEYDRLIAEQGRVLAEPRPADDQMEAHLRKREQLTDDIIRVRKSAEKLEGAAARYIQNFSSTNGAPEAPYKGSGWWELGFKAALQEAVKLDADAIALTTPAQISAATYTPEDVARKFYGENVPRYIDKYLKKWKISREAKALSGTPRKMSDRMVWLSPNMTPAQVRQYYERSQDPYGVQFAATIPDDISMDSLLARISASENARNIAYFSFANGEPPIIGQATTTLQPYWPLPEKVREEIRRAGQALAHGGDRRKTVHAVRALTRAGKAYVESRPSLAQQFDEIKSAEAALPEGTQAWLLQRIDPDPDKKGGVIATFVNREGVPYQMEADSLDALVQSRAFYMGAGASLSEGVFLVPLSPRPVSGLFERLRGEVRHEAIHALRQSGALPEAVWRSLVSHAWDLGVLDISMKDYLGVLGMESDDDRKIGAAYSRIYQGRPNFQEILDQEAVAHMAELYSHRALIGQDIAPVKSILDGIFRGEYSGGEGRQPLTKTIQPRILNLLQEALRNEFPQLGQAESRSRPDEEGQGGAAGLPVTQAPASGGQSSDLWPRIGSSLDRPRINEPLLREAINSYLGDYWHPQSAAKRAKLQGFVVPAWHSTKADFDVPQALRPHADYGFHVAIEGPEAALDRHGMSELDVENFLTDEHKWPEFRRQNLWRRRTDVRVLPVLIRSQNPFRMPDLGSWKVPELWIDWAIKIRDWKDDNHPYEDIARDILKLRYLLDDYSISADEMVDEFFRKVEGILEGAGYDSIIYQNEHEDAGADSLLVWDASRVRSAFDAFDSRAVGQPGLFASTPYLEADLRGELNALLLEEGLGDVLFALRPVTGEGQPIKDDPEFKKWFKDGVVTEPNGEPRIVYHSTLYEFTKFDPKVGNKGANLGRGFYFSSSAEDSTTNYGSASGPDIRSRIFDMMDRIAEEIEYDDDNENSPVSRDEIQEMAKQRLGMTHEGMAIPVYLNFQNPVIFGDGEHGKETFLEYDSGEIYDEETDDYEYGEPSGKLADFIEIIKDAPDKYDGLNVDGFVVELLQEAMDRGGVGVGELYRLFMMNPASGYAEDMTSGELTPAQPLREAFEKMGFDGIIDHTVSQKFPRMVGIRGATHYIAFKPNSIKSVFNRGTFDPDDPDIMFAIGGEKAKGADLTALNEAKTLLAKGRDRRVIWQKTGWMLGGDGRWKFEIDDSQLKLKMSISELQMMADEGYPAALGNVIDHPQLFAHYPKLADLPVQIKSGLEEGAGVGWFHMGRQAPWPMRWFREPEKAYLAVNLDSLSSFAPAFKHQFRQVVLHELQHAIQMIEDFAGGSNSDFEYGSFLARLHANRLNDLDKKILAAHGLDGAVKDVNELKKKIRRFPRGSEKRAEIQDRIEYSLRFLGELVAGERYGRSAGEIESRLVEDRMNLSPEQRRAIAPLDLAAEDVSYYYASKGDYGSGNPGVYSQVLPFGPRAPRSGPGRAPASVGVYASESLDLSGETATSEEALYQDYQGWAQSRSETPMSPEVFREAMRAQGLSPIMLAGKRRYLAAIRGQEPDEPATKLGQLLRRAKQLFSKGGVPKAKVTEQTGWYLDDNGQWKFKMNEVTRAVIEGKPKNTEKK